MRIVIDLQGAQSLSRFRGIGRYSLSLALAMARNAGSHEIWLALNGAFPESALGLRETFKDLIPEERIRIFEIPVPVAAVNPANAWRMCAAERIRECFLQQVRPDVIHLSSLFEGYPDNAITSVGAFVSGIRTAVTLYDLIPLQYPSEYLASNAQRGHYLRKVEYLKNAGLLLAISETSRREALESLGLPPDRVVNISAAVEGRFRIMELTAERIRQLRSRFGITRKMVMYAPGGFDWRKNFDGLIAAYSLLSPALRAGHQLVIAGNIDDSKRAYLQRLTKQARLARDELLITGYIPDEDLVEFYNLATAFVFPSKHEGFGLPALEAMACGVPTIGSNATSIPEVIGLSEALFDPSSPQDIAEKLERVLADEPFRAHLATHGLNQAKLFTWDACAKRAIEALEALAQDKAKAPPEMANTIPALLRSIAEINNAGEPTESDLLSIADCVAFNTGRDSPRQLLLDVSVIVRSDAKSGIQRVVRSLMRELINKPPPDTNVCLIYFDGNRYLYANEFASKLLGSSGCGISDDVVDFCQGDVYLALDLNAHLTSSVHGLHMRLKRRGIKLYFIVYDILLAQHPEWWPKGTGAVFDAWLRSISETATGLICISEAVAEEVRAWLRQNAPQQYCHPAVSSFHLGADLNNSLPSRGMPDNAQTVIGALMAKPSFLMVGTIEPRKGYSQALSAFEMLWDQGADANLVIVGKEGWLVEELVQKLKRHPELNRRLFWLEGISDEYLETVYAACTCLVSASRGEGFGLPLIEAAQHGKPIIARDLPVFREVAGEHAFYFNGLNAGDLADAILIWLSLHKKDMHPKPEGLRCITWRESALQLKALLGLDNKNWGGNC